MAMAVVPATHVFDGALLHPWLNIVIALPVGQYLRNMVLQSLYVDKTLGAGSSYSVGYDSDGHSEGVGKHASEVPCHGRKLG